ncbi:MAG TPA: hypothetical protein VGO59_17210 [Verrucomicrobiae bacterium]
MKWETEIGRILRSLPDLPAPAGFLERTLAAVERPAAQGIQPWAKWPAGWRIAFVLLALAGVAGAAIGWKTVEPGLLASAGHWLAPWKSRAASGWNVLTGLGSAAAAAARQLGTGFMLACLAAPVAACAVCAGFGTIFVRFAMARPRRN